MSEPVVENDQFLIERLRAKGYWCAEAVKNLREGRYSVTVRLCRENLANEEGTVSGRIVYAMALYLSGQQEAAAEEFYKVLARDPENLVALKHLGDIKFAARDDLAAMTYYNRILQIDPDCGGLKCQVAKLPRVTTRAIQLKRPAESVPEGRRISERSVPFMTETVGDLYLAQGHSRLAATVYRHLMEENQDPRIADKLAVAEGKAKQKES